MLFFAIFTLGYFAGVFTALSIFSPKVREIEEQEIDALKPILEIKNRMGKKKATSFGLPISLISTDLLKADS
ncbi:hypothetical protein IID21_03205 [Patescibacteria group bacterium]|nr:hypothetical protein [Patescibacteria group bacterium]